MLGYLTKHLPDLPLYVTSFDYQGSLEEQDLGDYQKVASYREFLDGFESSVGEKELLFVTGSLYFISEVRAYLMGYESID
jgi:tetrahydrofolate synthase